MPPRKREVKNTAGQALQDGQEETESVSVVSVPELSI